jgi:hypothetical protein
MRGGGGHGEGEGEVLLDRPALGDAQAPAELAGPSARPSTAPSITRVVEAGDSAGVAHQRREAPAVDLADSVSSAWTGLRASQRNARPPMR